MTPVVELIGNRIRIGPLVLSCDQALVVAHRIHDLLTPSFSDPEIGNQMSDNETTERNAP
jgi:hypothetical protein